MRYWAQSSKFFHQVSLLSTGFKKPRFWTRAICEGTATDPVVTRRHGRTDHMVGSWFPMKIAAQYRPLKHIRSIKVKVEGDLPLRGEQVHTNSFPATHPAGSMVFSMIVKEIPAIRLTCHQSSRRAPVGRA